MTARVLVHVVLLRFDPAATGASREAFLDGLRDLLERSPGARDARYGLDAGVDPDDDHYDFALVASFDDPDGYRAYEASPAHDEFVRRCASPIVRGRATVQLWWPR